MVSPGELSTYYHNHTPSHLNRASFKCHHSHSSCNKLTKGNNNNSNCSNIFKLKAPLPTKNKTRYKYFSDLHQPNSPRVLLPEIRVADKYYEHKCIKKQTTCVTWVVEIVSFFSKISKKL